jgi:hypothetical protein
MEPKYLLRIGLGDYQKRVFYMPDQRLAKELLEEL